MKKEDKSRTIIINSQTSEKEISDKLLEKTLEFTYGTIYIVIVEDDKEATEFEDLECQILYVALQFKDSNRLDIWVNNVSLCTQASINYAARCIREHVESLKDIKYAAKCIREHVESLQDMKEFSTLEMMQDWIESGCKKKYLLVNSNTRLPITAYNNGCGILFKSYFTITIGEPIRESCVFTVDGRHLPDDKWREIKEEYSIMESIEKSEKGCCMKSVQTGNLIHQTDKFTKEEILGKWFELYKSDANYDLSD